MVIDFSQFHFMRPEWLIAIPVAIIFLQALKHTAKSSNWEAYIPKGMLAALQVNSAAQQSSWWRWAPIACSVILILSAAGPTWTKQAVPVVKNQKALVVILDLSPSMLAQDLKPNRLTLAKFKLIDIIRRQADGQVALIAYAGDAHTVSPLTDDPRTIEALMPALHPSIMPVEGSNTEAAVSLAMKLLRDAGAPSGDMLLITDGIASDAIDDIRKQIKGTNTLSILGVGSTDAAPIPDKNGGFRRKENGEIILTSVNSRALNTLASDLGGHFSMLATNESDIDRLLSNSFENNNDNETQTNTEFDAWADMGHWLVLLALPLALIFFRRGVVYIVPLFFVLPIDSNAAENENFSWTDLWQTPDQQAAQLFEQEQYADAANKFDRQDWSAIANYRNGDYKNVITDLEGQQDSTSLYNTGNALAFSGELEKAIEAYTKVLEQQPDHTDAAHNKKVLEQLMQQNEDQEQSEQGQESEQDKQSSQDQQNDQQQSSEQQDSEQQDSEQQQDQNSEQQQNESENQDQQSPQDSDSQKDEAEQESESQQSQADQKKDEQQEAEAQDTAEQQAEKQDEQEQSPEEKLAAAAGEPTEEPLKDASEQWLRTIEDDPSGLLRRKFQYQTQQRQRNNQSKRSSAQDRY